MTTFRWILLVGTTGLVLLIVWSGWQTEPHHVIKVAAPLNRDHPTASSLLVFKEHIEKQSNGEIRVDVFFDSQLGSADETLNLARMGDIDIALISSAVLLPYVPEANAVAMPFIWEGPEHQRRVMNGEVGERLRIYARPSGIEILTYLDSGTRNISTTRGPIEKPEDLSGMKIRMMGQPLMFATMNILGASAMSLNMGEVFTGLQMGVVDGWENNPTTIASYRMWETGAIYFAWTHHFSLPDLLIAGQPFYERLTDQQRQWVYEAISITTRVQHERWEESERNSVERMRQAGMVISEVDLDAFRERVQPLYEEYKSRYGERFAELVDLILSEQ